ECRDAQNRRQIRAHEATSYRETPGSSPVALLPVPETPGWASSPEPSWSRPLPPETSLIWRAVLVGDVVATADDVAAQDSPTPDDAATDIVLSRQRECSTLLWVGERCLGR